MSTEQIEVLAHLLGMVIGVGTGYLIIVYMDRRWGD